MVGSAPSELPYACSCSASIGVDNPRRRSAGRRRVVADFTRFRSFGLPDLLSQTSLPSIFTGGEEEAPGISADTDRNSGAPVPRQTSVGTSRAAEAFPNTGTGLKPAMEKPALPNERGAPSASDGLEERLRQQDEKEHHAAVEEAIHHLGEATQGMPGRNTNSQREVYPPPPHISPSFFSARSK